MGAPAEQVTTMIAMASTPSPSTKQAPIKQLAYSITPPSIPSQLYRVERGQPYIRGGTYIFSTPQFRALYITSPVQQTIQVSGAAKFTNAVAAVQNAATSLSNSQITAVQNTALTVKYPVKTK